MKTYKLIKRYPGSPEIGDTVTWSKEKNMYEGNTYRCSISQVQNYPEFWKEIIGEFPRIVTIRRTVDSGHGGFKKGYLWNYINGSFKAESCDNTLSAKELLDGKDHEIYQVQTSENEIFTLGDIVKYSGLYIRIDNFFYDPDENRILARSANGIIEDVTTIVKAKQPLFTTEDGVEIYKGDKFFYTDGNRVLCAHADGRFGPHVSFSTNEAAQKYIYLNEKRYSINDIETAIKTCPEIISPDFMSISGFKSKLAGI